MYRSIAVWLSLLLSSPLAAAAEDLEEAHYASIPERCVTDVDPRACLESNGYECRRHSGMSIAMNAYWLGCNARLSTGRAHFAQLMFDGSDWIVETQRVYTPEPVRERVEPYEPDEMLERYLYSLIENGQTFGGGMKPDESGHLIVDQVELDRRADTWTLRVLCGLVVEQSATERASTIVRRECQKRALKITRNLSQADQTSPFRAPGANELYWSESLATLESGDTAVIAEARHQFPQGHVACRLRSHCCSGPGSTFLGSCRAPTEAEETAVDACLGIGLRARTTEYTECLIANGVKVGCEMQDDGSRLCY